MKKQLLIVLAFLLGSNVFGTSYYLISSGGDTYVPATLQINLGDTVWVFAGNFHTTREVSYATWMADDTTALPGGFGDKFNGDFIVPTSLGDIYYVCTEHVASDGMKGMIKVSQLGVPTNNAFSMKILQSVAEQYIELLVTGGQGGEVHIEMMNLSGQVVRTTDVEVTGDEITTIIEVGDLPKGVYMVRWSYGTVNKAKKIILQ